MTMKLSVLIITFNHRRYIAQAIESVLMQQADFDWEIVIGDDCSTDGTREIVADYAARYPGKIRALLYPHNKGLWGVRNFADTYRSCRGKYIAILEGDDYWTSPHKLQKQVEIMERDKGVALTAHNMLVIHEDESKKSYLLNKDTPAIIPFERLVIPAELATGSLILRRYFSKLPEWYFKYSFGDYALVLLQASYGKVFFNPEAMGVYRKHYDALTYNPPWDADRDFFNICADVDKYTNYRHHNEIRNGMTRLYIYKSCSYNCQKKVFKTLSFMLKAMGNSRRVRDFFPILLRCVIPERIKSLIKSQTGLRTKWKIR